MLFEIVEELGFAGGEPFEFGGDAGLDVEFEGLFAGKVGLEGVR